MDLTALQQLLGALAGARVLSVGDLMVDRFVHGNVGRISAEAPIPVLARSREHVMLGGAGNVARNVAALGGVAALVGVVGVDATAHEATRLVGAEDGIEGFLIPDADRPTTTKTRFVAAGQQLLRVDVEETRPVADELERRLTRTIRDAAKGAGVILISDYGKGVITPPVIAACLEAASASGARVIVDSKARHFGRYGPVDIIKPNSAELAYATDMPVGDDAEIEAALAKALALSACKAVLVTRGGEGMTLAVRDGPTRHFSRPAVEVFDASGAGDTVLAAIGLAMASGATQEAAIELALIAAGVAVQKAGTATVSPDEVLEAELQLRRSPAEAKFATATRMVATVEGWRARGLRIGFTNGCFDLIHPGHIAYLAQARAWCDRLIVGLNTDRSVRELKGESRPVNGLEARALVLAGLSSVDLVVPFDEVTPAALIEAARPDVLVKGGDYRVDAVVGHDFVTSYGGEVKLAPFVEGHSTTATLRRLTESA
jgi:D-beta-D-heptose 7-phosphate kinase/D-beta-D-heptose 1-phosphate adenosyltransferase